jgi:hypothetical protein
MDLEQGLRDVGENLDHPAGDQIVPGLRDRLAQRRERGVHLRSRHRVIVTAAVASLAAAVVLAVAVVSFVAGSTESPEAVRPPVRHDHSATTTTTDPLPEILDLDLERARAAVEFPIGVPGPSGVMPARVTVDRRVPGGLVALEYPAFTVVQVASSPDAAANLAATMAAEGDVQVMSVRGRPALWITGDHGEIPFLDREGTLRRSPARPTGHVLLWEERGVTFRVEGFESEASARRMADSIS